MVRPQPASESLPKTVGMTLLPWFCDMWPTFVLFQSLTLASTLEAFLGGLHRTWLLGPRCLFRYPLQHCLPSSEHFPGVAGMNLNQSSVRMDQTALLKRSTVIGREISTLLIKARKRKL